MLHLSQPDELFRRQPLYEIGGDVDKHGAVLTSSVRLAVVLSGPVSELPLPLKEMIEKLIAACKVNAADVVYLDAGSTGVSYQHIQANYHPQVMLFFGDMPVSRNLTGLKRNLPYEFNGTKILLAQTLDYIAKTAPEKNALWAGLQKLFALK